MSVITIGNFKGGVGKTTVSTLLLYIASERYEKSVYWSILIPNAMPLKS